MGLTVSYVAADVADAVDAILLPTLYHLVTVVSSWSLSLLCVGVCSGSIRCGRGCVGNQGYRGDWISTRV